MRGSEAASNPRKWARAMGAKGCAAAYVFERWVRLDGRAKKPAPTSAPPAKRSDARFRVIEGGRNDDDDRPEYLH